MPESTEGREGRRNIVRAPSSASQTRRRLAARSGSGAAQEQDGSLLEEESLRGTAGTVSAPSGRSRVVSAMAAGVANLTDCVVGGGHHSILWAGGIENIWLTCMLFGCLVSSWTACRVDGWMSVVRRSFVPAAAGVRRCRGS